uniref:Methionine adenosyltransferase 2 subunit beta n=1 Tax=Equus asinus TaxID=9793 RepID=A0A9L0KKJ4_EQUAS
MVGREKELAIHFVPGNCRLEEEEVNIPSRRVLVTGATGLLGRAVYKEFKQNNWHAFGCGYRRARPKFEQVNLLDSDAVHHIVYDFQITDSPVLGALRPRNAQLDCSKLETLGIGQRTPFRIGIKESLWPFLIDKRWRQTVFH